MTHEKLVNALRSQARGVHAYEAAVSLLVEHGSWLRRADFLRFVKVLQTSRDNRQQQVLMASVDWEAVLTARLPGSSSETQMLAIAAELAGADSRRPLGELLCGLDESNTTLVMRAVLHASRGGKASPGKVSVSPVHPLGLRTNTSIGAPRTAPLPPAGEWPEPEGLGL